MTGISPLAAGSLPDANPSAGQAKNKPSQDVQEMAASFEAIFIRNMLSSMRTASLGEGLFESHGMKEFQNQQDAMLADKMAEQGVFGVAELLARHVENQNV